MTPASACFLPSFIFNHEEVGVYSAEKTGLSKIHGFTIVETVLSMVTAVRTSGATELLLNKKEPN
jgi:hypothetical protein